MAWKHALGRLLGSSIQFDLQRYEPSLREIAGLEAECARLSDDGVRQRACDLRARARAGEPLAALRGPWYALAREAARRALGQRPHDEQVLAGLALDDGHVVEMQTGEGKTLAAVLPAALNALSGRGVHVLTFNDYLARRDAEWMGPVYRGLGLEVASIDQHTPRASRHARYAADVTYVTAKEAGFDHLRDCLAAARTDLVHRPLHMALVDEADSLLIDEATAPLVLAGATDGTECPGRRMAALVASLAAGAHFDVDEHRRNVELTEEGIERIEGLLGAGFLHRAENAGLLAEVNCALHARVLLRRDVDYIVRGGRIEVVDEHTGRVVTDRYWPDGLQAALEAKEGIARRADGRILASITLPRLMRGYRKLCGMSGTARDAAVELKRTYGLDVVVVPTHRPVARIDRDDVVFTHRDAKEQAIVRDVLETHATGRPVLVGTATVRESERLAARLRETGIRCEVLNAKNDAEEAGVVARAGAVGAVTISTNMAGRGTDIRLGGPGERDRRCVAALGGLYVIGANRHESRRVDLQLRGRAGRQGDPGESRFYVSLDDDLAMRYGLRSLIAGRAGPPRSDAPIESGLVRREIARTQRIAEGQNLEIRRTLGRYASVVERQHELLLEHRRALLSGDVDPGVWRQAPNRRAALARSVGERALIEAERTVTIACIDQAWCDHLAFCAELREGIHLVRLGGADPLARFVEQAVRAFAGIEEAIDCRVRSALADVRVIDGRIDLTAAGPKAPSSTWTYLINDDPFHHRIGALLTAPGGNTVAIYAASLLAPLLMLWGALERWRRRGAGCGSTTGVPPPSS